ncbi:MAG: c-type cytochrome biogenesis protein CcmI [Zoogloeaceae bacterium]|nr:c-type cytochrome biogenesis protein CcmI [Zoogloeaceae bacterium]
MITFLALAALLVAFALLLLIPPLVRVRRSPAPPATDQAGTALSVLREQLAELEVERAAGRIDETSYLRNRHELERRALEEGEGEPVAGPRWQPARGWGIALLVGLPTLAAGFYLMLGNPAGLDPAKVAGGSQHQFTPEQVEGMVAKLAARLESEPDNLEGWMMLARSYTMLGRAEAAEKAYRHLAAKMPDNAQVIADWADALGAARGGSLLGEPEALIARALKLEPRNMKALALAGSAAFEKADYAGAAHQWERILEQLPPSEELAESVRASVAEARAKAGLPPLAGAPSTPMAAMPAPPGPGLTLRGEIRLAPALAAQAKAEDTVFVFARGGEVGPPIAALRLTVAQLPARFDFTGAPLMNPAGGLPEKVVVGVRVSRSGQPVGAPGDLEGFSPPVAPGAQGVLVTVDRVRP